LRFPGILTLCKIVESKALAELGSLSVSATNDWCSVRTPKLYHFDPETNTQVQEYLAAGVDLKNYALKRYEPHTSNAKKPQCLGLGQGLGEWLSAFHERAEFSEALRTMASENKALQRLKHSTYYDALVQIIDKFPSILPQAKEVFESVKAMSERELEDDSTLHVCHADAWTGKLAARRPPPLY
jgi:hypothetical protein